MKMGAYAELDGELRAAAEARDLVRAVLGDSHPAVGDAVLLASELVTNAVTHTRSGRPGGTVNIGIEVTAQPPEVRIRVRDAGGHSTPVVGATNVDGEHGRGLAIIASLASDWGTEVTDSGRTTWCRLVVGANEHRGAADEHFGGMRYGRLRRRPAKRNATAASIHRARGIELEAGR
jgi:anti-sigma regulatory factor (Ser/Thr protein kinase)